MPPKTNFGAAFLAAKDAKRVVHLGNLPYKSSKEKIEIIVSNHVNDDDCKFYWVDSSDKPHEGWCEVEFADNSSAARAVSGLASLKIRGRDVNASISVHRDVREDTLKCAMMPANHQTQRSLSAQTPQLGTSPGPEQRELAATTIPVPVCTQPQMSYPFL